VRLTDFWTRMDAVFGPEYARSWARDFVVTPLGSTVIQAFDRGEDVQVVWRAVCEVAEVPSVLR
jgi:hypothetical protein